MGILIEFLLDFLADMGPSSDRGIVGTFAVTSGVFALLTVWLLLTDQNPLTHSWGLLALAGPLVCGAAGLLTSVLHLTRNESDRAFAVVCLTANVGAIAIAMLGISST